VCFLPLAAIEVIERAEQRPCAFCFARVHQSHRLSKIFMVA